MEVVSKGWKGSCGSLVHGKGRKEDDHERLSCESVSFGLTNLGVPFEYMDLFMIH
jgi:hypothetical protein